MFSRESRVLSHLYGCHWHPNGFSGVGSPLNLPSTEGSSPSVPLVDLRPNGAPVRYYAVEEIRQKKRVETCRDFLKMKWNMGDFFFGCRDCLCIVFLDIGVIIGGLVGESVGVL